MSLGSVFAIAAVYAAYSGCFYVIEWLFAHDLPKMAVLAALSSLLVNWAAAAVATSGHAERSGRLLWLLFGAVIPFLGGLGLLVFAPAESERRTGLALMFGTLLPVLMFVYLGLPSIKERFFRGGPPAS